MLIATAVFLVIWLLFFGVYWAFAVRPERRAERALLRRLHPAGSTRRAPRSLLREALPVSTVPYLEKALRRSRGLVDRSERLIFRSGCRLTAGQLILASVLAGCLGFVVLQQGAVPLVLSGAAGVALTGVPSAVLRFAARRRQEKIQAQFPEAIDLMARALRAGHAFTAGLGMVADDAPEPTRTEFRLVYDQQNYGMPLREALQRMADRVPLLDVRFFVTAVLTQRESGGNLADVLDSLAAVIRDRFRLRRQVRVLSAHGRITATVLAGLPVAIGGLLYLLAPGHVMTLFTDPLGVRMVGAAVLLQVLGFFWMRKVVDIKV